MTQGLWVIVGLLAFLLLEKMFPDQGSQEDPTPEADLNFNSAVSISAEMRSRWHTCSFYFQQVLQLPLLNKYCSMLYANSWVILFRHDSAHWGWILDFGPDSVGYCGTFFCMLHFKYLIFFWYTQQYGSKGITTQEYVLEEFAHCCPQDSHCTQTCQYKSSNIPVFLECLVQTPVSAWSAYFCQFSGDCCIR